MTGTFDASVIAELGWRQGAVLGPALFQAARDAAPPELAEQLRETDWLIVTSHDCDIVNFRLEKEPTVELLRAVPRGRGKPDKQQTWGRNPRTLELVVADTAEQAQPLAPGAPPPDTTTILRCDVHQRWHLPRQHLVVSNPRALLPDKERRLVAEWLAKRYIRAAFPGAFDGRWRGDGSRNLKRWSKLLTKHSQWIQGVYLRLSTLKELPEGEQYRCHLFVTAPRADRRSEEWVNATDAIQEEVLQFWSQFEPGIECVGVEVFGTDEITLADLEPYQRFDADWVSFADDTAMTPITADITK